jgi:uncharacterized membrane protein YgdD (TMEM256/DUF423 family)
VPPGALFLILAALFGASGVALGAFGAHGLRNHLAPSALEVWQTAVLYQLLHALALLVAGLWLRLGAGQANQGALLTAGWSFTAGMLLFSGSLYALALGGPRLLGPLTPVGGVALIAGWLAVLWAAVRTANP